MRNYYVSRDRFSWRWKEQSGLGWNNFTDNVIDQKTMQDYFTSDRRHDPVSLSFVDRDLHPAKIFELRRKGNTIDAVVNGGERKFIIYDFEFIPNAETLRFFHDRTTDDINQEANKLSAELERIMFYKKSADEQTLSTYRNLVAERMTDGAIRNYLQDYEPGKVSEVYFAKDSVIPNRISYHD